MDEFQEQQSASKESHDGMAGFEVDILAVVPGKKSFGSGFKDLMHF